MKLPQHWTCTQKRYVLCLRRASMTDQLQFYRRLSHLSSLCLSQKHTHTHIHTTHAHIHTHSQVVQQALDTVMVGRTSVVVAHRLSTIRNAHKIALVHRGAILEQVSADCCLTVCCVRHTHVCYVLVTIITCLVIAIMFLLSMYKLVSTHCCSSLMHAFASALHVRTPMPRLRFYLSFYATPVLMHHKAVTLLTTL